MLNRFRYLWLAYIVALAGCAGLPGKELVEPEVFVRDFQVTEMTLSGLEGVVSLDVRNPNDSRLSARSLDYVFIIADRELVTGATDENFSIAALGQETIELPVRISYQALLETLPNIFRTKSADYTIKGNLDTIFVTVPFTKQGTLGLPNFTDL